MKTVLLSTWALFFGYVCVTMSLGLQAPLLTMRAFDEGFDTSDTGLIMAGLFAGFQAGALMIPRMVRHVGHAKVFAAVASITSGLALLFASFVDPVVWFGLRFMIGFCLATITVVIETWLNNRSPNDVRGKIMNLYVMLCYFALGTGALLLNLGDPQGIELFILTSVLISFGIVPILLSAQPAPAYEAPKRLGALALYRKAPLGVGAVFMTGLVGGALVGAAPIFADKSGLTTAEISIFVAVMFLGSLIFMWPIGIVTDRCDRAKTLIAVALLAALVSLMLFFTPIGLEIVLLPLTGLFSGLALSIYGICSAITYDYLEPDEMVGGGATLYICHSVGLMLGPVLSAELMEAWQPSAYFLYLAAVHVLIVVYALALRARPGLAPAPRRRPIGGVTHPGSYWAAPSWMEGSSRPNKNND